MRLLLKKMATGPATIVTVDVAEHFRTFNDAINARLLHNTHLSMPLKGIGFADRDMIPRVFGVLSGAMKDLLGLRLSEF